MKKLLFIAAILMHISSYTFADSIEDTLTKKGHVVICAQTSGVLHIEDLHNEINKKILAIKERVYLSVPAVSISLLNVGEKNMTEPGALAVICVTVSKNK